MMHSIVIVLFVLLQTNHPQRACICPAVPSQEQTRRGNENVIISTVTRVRELRGTISDSNDAPMPNALVEVFTHPERAFLPYNPAAKARRPEQRRVAACLTNAEGEFCLSGLPPGSYELRSSAQGFQTVSQPIKIVAKGRAKKHVFVKLPVAT